MNRPLVAIFPQQRACSQASWSAMRHASVRRRRRLHAVKTFKVGGHHFASLSDKTDQSSGVGDSRKK